jgi:hypothetical protein
MKGDISACLHCGQDFVKRQARSRTCSERCRVGFWLASQTEECNESDCRETVQSRGKCSRHYQAMRAYERRHGVKLNA